MLARRCIEVIIISLIVVPAGAFGSPAAPIESKTSLSSFDDVWVVDRVSPEVYQVLAAISTPGLFDAIVLTGSDGRRAEVVNHLLEIVPEGTSHWVSHQPVPAGLLVDRVLNPLDLMAAQPRGGAIVWCADESLRPLAALIAMRTDSRLVDEMPSFGAFQIIQIGGDDPVLGPAMGNDLMYLRTAERAIYFANTMATRSAVMVFAAHTLRPEHVLYAFQRGVLLVQVEPPPSTSDDLESEIEATLATHRQIRAAVEMIGELEGELPEALIIAGDWTEIPYRFARSTDRSWVGCGGCDNGIRTFSADAEYANFDMDPWGEPDVAVGRIMSYDPDLLAIQTVIGLWHDFHAFEPGPRATFLGLFPGSLREIVTRGWQDGLWDLQWEFQGPETADQYGSFDFDANEFLFYADDSDVVLFDGHGSPNTLSDSRRLFNGEILASTASSARPAFWFVAACATARHISTASWSASPDGNANLVSGLQTRLIFGALLTVEASGSASGHLAWSTMVLERGLTIGELVRRSMAVAISAYRGDPGSPEIPRGMPRRYGTRIDFSNAWITNFWVGDPLTVF